MNLALESTELGDERLNSKDSVHLLQTQWYLQIDFSHARLKEINSAFLCTSCKQQTDSSFNFLITSLLVLSEYIEKNSGRSSYF